MTVHELIEILEKMDQDAIVKIPCSIHPDCGVTLFKTNFDVVQEQVRFDIPVYEVFIE